MSYRTILVYLDSKQRAPALLSVAVKLAEQHSAHLTGLYVSPPLQVYSALELPVPSNLMENHMAYHDALAGSLQALFDKATENLDVVTEWRKVENETLPVADTIIELAHTVDLVVLAQKNADAANSDQSELPERVLLSAGRPVIVVPGDAPIKHIGQEIFVAWNGRKEAARAVFDALPILRDADNVSVHMINPAGLERRHVLGTSAELINTLSRHGVNVGLSQSDAKRYEVGEELMNYAGDKGADLLVMGVYGRRRLSEILFGGASREILRDMKIPVLMSH